MNQRLQEIDIPSLERLQAQCLWFHDGHVVGRGPEQMVAAELGLRAFAWQEGQPAPTIRPGSWKMQISGPGHGRAAVGPHPAGRGRLFACRRQHQ